MPVRPSQRVIVERLWRASTILVKANASPQATGGLLTRPSCEAHVCLRAGSWKLSRTVASHREGMAGLLAFLPYWRLGFARPTWWLHSASICLVTAILVIGG
jgi:hypothetical protein